MDSKDLCDEMWARIEYILQNSSCHGGNWVNKWQNVNIKSIGTITVFCMQIALIYYIILRLSSTNYDVSTSFQWENKDLLYPNITICNPRLFDRQKVKEMNLTDELLAYLYLPVTYEHGVFLYPQLEPYYVTYEKQLETRDLDVNILPHLAIKCEDFLSECFTLFKSSARCCGDVFDTKPYFSSLGTCFTTKPIQLVYNNPLDVLGITTNVSTKYSTGINSKTYGAIFAKQAIDLAFHSQDQGLVAINRNSLSFDRGTTNKVKLQRVEVDRTLASKTFTLEPTDSDEVASCISNGEEYDLSQDLGWPAWTKANCEFYVSALYLSSCSYMQTIGIESNFFGNEEEIIKQFDIDYERKTCRPLDFMNNSMNTTRLDKIAELRKRWCVPNCIQENFEHTKTSANLNDDEYGQDFSDTILIELSYSTSTTTKYKMITNPKSFADKISDIGGMIGIMMGASIISILELLYFYCDLVGFGFSLLKRKLFSSRTSNMPASK